MAQSFLEGVMQTIERALAIEGRCDERAVYLRERTVIQLLPCLDGDLGHARGNAIGGLDRLVASPHSTGRRRGAPGTSPYLFLVTPKVVVAEPPAPSACGREARKLAIVYSSGAPTMG